MEIKSTQDIPVGHVLYDTEIVALLNLNGFSNASITVLHDRYHMAPDKFFSGALRGAVKSLGEFISRIVEDPDEFRARLNGARTVASFAHAMYAATAGKDTALGFAFGVIASRTMNSAACIAITREGGADDIQVKLFHPFDRTLTNITPEQRAGVTHIIL